MLVNGALPSTHLVNPVIPHCGCYIFTTRLLVNGPEHKISVTNGLESGNLSLAKDVLEKTSQETLQKIVHVCSTY